MTVQVISSSGPSAFPLSFHPSAFDIFDGRCASTCIPGISESSVTSVTDAIIDPSLLLATTGAMLGSLVMNGVVGSR